ncbi:MAG: NUDIX hydrolase [Candidatus Dormibacteraeota bacterium]|uniref:NUDIX hydrolase n=1 Tax=Candidatus Amunia macphersoniae TaxID=3127014 RepID=A0A934NGF6_9BACT|nr:NUDIX hydrolase [Candidatus Dormibacteraeota bacterium]
MQGAQTAIVDGSRVLLQLRPFPPGWELPGGHVDPGEDPAETAVRETEEETGLRVNIRGLVGVYSWSGLRNAADAVFLAEVAGGRLRWSIEAWRTVFVSADRLPRTAFPWCRQRVYDALARSEGAPPVHRVQPVTLRNVATFGTSWLSAPLDRIRSRGNSGDGS